MIVRRNFQASDPKISSSAGSAFTLAELLVAVAITAILASLLLPALSRSKGQGKSASCKDHLRQLGLALQMYVQDDRDRYPYYLGPAGPSYGDEIGDQGKATGLVYWSSKLFPYYTLNWTNPSFQCPGYTGTTTGSYRPGTLERHGSYGYNIWGSRCQDPPIDTYGVGPVVFWKNSQGASVPAVAEAQVAAPSEMLAMGDSAWIVGTVAGTGLGVGVEPGGDDTLTCNLNAWGYIYDVRHGQNYNQLFCDGHVSSKRPQILFVPSNTAAMWNYDHQPHPEGWEIPAR